MVAEGRGLVLVVLVCGLCCLVERGDAKCPPDTGTVTPWVPIPADLYDRNFSSIAEPGRRPLGFAQAVLLHNVEGNPTPCIRVSASNAVGQYLEITFQTLPPTRLCYLFNGMAEPECAQGTLRKCFPLPANPTHVEFLCDSSCDTQDVKFWYRFEVSPPISEAQQAQGVDGEPWCMDRSPDEFPLSLAGLPDGASFPRSALEVHDRNLATTVAVPHALLLLPLLAMLC